MARANRQASENPDQGSFFEVEWRGNGSTDPDSYAVNAELTLQPDGVYNTDANPTGLTVEEAAVIQGINNAIARHSHAQSGKHSPLQRDGAYSLARPGDYLPGFGPVTHTNREDAARYAEQLDRNRKRPHKPVINGSREEF